MNAGVFVGRSSPTLDTRRSKPGDVPGPTFPGNCNECNQRCRRGPFLSFHPHDVDALVGFGGPEARPRVGFAVFYIDDDFLMENPSRM